MRLRGSDLSRRAPRPAGWLLATVVGACAATWAVAAAQPTETYPRHDAETIRQRVREILQSPRFAEKRTLTDWLREWLSELRLGSWLGDSTTGIVLFRMLLVAAGLVVVGVLVHFILSLVAAYRGRGAIESVRAVEPHFRALGRRSYDELCLLMARLRDEGNVAGAIGVMMLALLRYLEGAGLLGFDESKTNGDYVREYARSGRGREAFRRFIGAFERRIYAGAPCRAVDYQQMMDLFKTVQRDVHPEP